MHDAVIFDCDGVLVDSEYLVIEIESAMLAKLGAQISPAEIARHFTGLSDAAMNSALARDWGVTLPATFDTERTKRATEAFERSLTPVQGIADVLAWLSVPRCVASSSAFDRISSSLSLTGLTGYFGDHLYSAAMVAHGKPAPDLFLYAADKLHAAPERCIVVEDSPHGVEAGRAAGMYVIGFTAGRHCTTDHAERLTAAGAHHVAATSSDLRLALEDLT